MLAVKLQQKAVRNQACRPCSSEDAEVRQSGLTEEIKTDVCHGTRRTLMFAFKNSSLQHVFQIHILTGFKRCQLYHRMMQCALKMNKVWEDINL